MAPQSFDRLKVKVYCPTEDSSQNSLDVAQAEVIRIFTNCGFVVERNTLLLAPSVQANYEDSVIEFETVVRPHPLKGGSFNSRQQVSMTLVQQWCTESALGLEKQFRLEILSQDGFDLDCKPHHDNIDITVVAFGSFINNGIFGFHHMTSAFVVKENLKLTGDHLLSMYAHFEHDRRSLLIKLISNETEVQQDASNATGVQLEISYNSIHSIVIDTNSVQTEGQRLMYLTLKWPPQVWHAIPRETPQINSYRPRNNPNYSSARLNMDRCREWIRDVEWKECSKSILAECPVLCIGFTKTSFQPQRNPQLFGQSPDLFDQLYQIISRLKSRSNVRLTFSPIYFKKIDIETDNIKPICRPQFGSENSEESFRVSYAITALLSRGAVVKNQIKSDLCQHPSKAPQTFFDLVKYCFNENPTATAEALEMLLSAIDEKKNLTLVRAFNVIYRIRKEDYDKAEAGELVEPYGPDIPSSCLLVRKVMVTPTRKLYLAPEVMMSNRVLRQFGEEFALRCVFRDDDGSKLGNAHMTRGRSALGRSHVVEHLILSTLQQGVHISGRHYQFLAWSNSQMRDQGCYLYSRTNTYDKNHNAYLEYDANAIRDWMGDFASQINVPKMMARMGQGLTQTQVTIPLKDAEWVVEDDIVGGTTGKFVFSDGVGRMTPSTAAEIANLLGISPVPSVFQIRFKGLKGVLSVDPDLESDPRNLKIAFRESQRKFDDPGQSSTHLEAVKHSMPSPVFLNRPLIMILDQVSEKQGRDIHFPIVSRVHGLLEKELFAMADMLCSEQKSSRALHERLPIRMNFPRMKNFGFYMTTEPFFRSLLLAVHRYNIKQQLYKAKVEIPTNLGRTMYGILDETGRLQYNQIFVQYSVNMKKPGTPDQPGSTKILDRPVLVTKNPCLPPGDVRRFKAVNESALHHLVDVIVFPKHGPRPLPDEMAGSDLDGDEYSVFWDDDLMFDHNEEPMNYDPAVPEVLDRPPNVDDMINFFVKYLSQDSIGMLSNAHLVRGDRFSIFDRTCMEIARKCSMAVDFPKSGKPADNLENDERPAKYPDYMQKIHKPCYRSRRLIGQLFRKSKVVEDIIDLGQHSVKRRIRDPDLNSKFLKWCEMSGFSERWDVLTQQAERTRDRYFSHIQSLLDNYGIADESSLVSGHMVTVKNRISDNEKEDFSYYNTEKLLELRYGRIYDNFRNEFFVEWGSGADPYADKKKELDDVSVTYPDYMQYKAMAWYMVTYGEESGNKTGFLSFPWLVWDILTFIKGNEVFGSIEEKIVFDPLQESLGRAMESFYNEKQANFDDRMIMLRKKSAIARYCDLYVDMPVLLVSILNWADREQLLRRGAIQQEHLCLLLIQFGLGKLGYAEKDDQPKIPYLVEQANSEEKRYFRLPNSRFDRKGAFLLDFMKFLASQNFFTRQTLDFRDVEYNCRFRRGEWHHLSRVAFKTYHHIALTADFDSLGLTSDQGNSHRIDNSIGWDWGEMDTAVMVELPFDYEQMSDTTIEEYLREWSGVEYLSIRRPFDRQTQNVLVSASGSLGSRQRLQRILLADNLYDKLRQNECPPEADQEMF